MTTPIGSGDDFDTLAAGVFDDGPFGDDSPEDAPQDFPQASIDLAFRLWAFDAQRNPRKVAELLQQRTGVAISVATVRRWSLRYRWADRALHLHQTFRPLSKLTIEASIDTGAVRAIEVLREILDDPGATSTAKVKAATAVLSLAGFTPLPMGASAISVNVHAPRDDWGRMSDEELEAMAEAYDNSQAVTPPLDVTWQEATTAGYGITPDSDHDIRKR